MKRTRNEREADKLFCDPQLSLDALQKIQRELSDPKRDNSLVPPEVMDERIARLTRGRR